MKKTAFLAAIAVLWLMSNVAVQAHGESMLKNTGFEQHTANNAALPAAWENDRANSGYDLVIHGGRQKSTALRIRFDADADKDGYAGVLQRVDLAPQMASTSIVVRGWLKKDNAKSVAGLWVMFADGDGKKLDYQNDYEVAWQNPTGWNKRELKATIPPGARRMIVGASVYEATGMLLVDEIRLMDFRPQP